MATKLIKLQDDVLVEVDVSGEQYEEISGKAADKVQIAVDHIKPILLKTCRPIISAWQELSKEMTIEQAEIELGLGFEIEGNIYVTKSTANANLIVKLIIKPNDIGLEAVQK